MMIPSSLSVILLTAMTANYARAETCGDSNIPYTPTTQMCCAGMVFGRNTSFIICCRDRIFGLGDPSAKRFWDCCADQAYDTRYQQCEGGRPIAKQATSSDSLRWTTPAIIDYFETSENENVDDHWSTVPWTTPVRKTTTRPTTEATTEAVTTTRRRPPTTTPTTTEEPTTRRPIFFPRITTRPTTTTITTRQQFVVTTPTAGVVDVSSDGDQQRSCTDRPYNPATQVCCGGYVYVRSTPTVLCCAGALFAIGETDGDPYWHCCGHTIFDNRRQTCANDDVVIQMPKVIQETRPPETILTPPQPPPQREVINEVVTLAPPPVFPPSPTFAPATLAQPRQPQTLPPPTFAPNVVPGFKAVTCSNGEALTVRDTGTPMACCGRTLYDSSQQVCLGDQYTIHKSLVPGLPAFFVNVLNTSIPVTFVEETSTAPPTPPPRPTTKTTTTTTLAPTTTQSTTSQTSGSLEMSNKMEISCSGNVYQVPFTRLDKVACCGQYLYDARYYQCFNGAVVAVNSPNALKVPPLSTNAQKEYVTSMPFVHSFFPTPALPMPIQPRSFDRSEQTTRFASLIKLTTIAPPAPPSGPFILPSNGGFDIPTMPFSNAFPTEYQKNTDAGNDDSFLSIVPKPHPSIHVIGPEADKTGLGSLPYIPFWNPQSMKQNVPPNMTMPVQPSKIKPTAPANSETYGSQLSQWNRLPPAGDYEPGLFGAGDQARASLPTPIGKFPSQLFNLITTPKYQQQQIVPNSNVNWLAPPAPAPAPIRNTFPGFVPPDPRNKPIGAALPKPVGVVEPQKQELPTAINNWPHPSSFVNSLFPANDQHLQQFNSFPPVDPSVNVNGVKYVDNTNWRDFQQPGPGFLMTPVIPIESKPLRTNLLPQQIQQVISVRNVSHNFLSPPINNNMDSQPAPPPRQTAKSPRTDARCQNGRLLQAPTVDQDYIYCCSNAPYDIRSQFCCGGTVEEWLGSDSGRVYQLCCDGVYIYNVNGDPNVQCCGRTAINTKYEPCSSVSL